MSSIEMRVTLGSSLFPVRRVGVAVNMDEEPAEPAVARKHDH